MSSRGALVLVVALAACGGRSLSRDAGADADAGNEDATADVAREVGPDVATGAEAGCADDARRSRFDGGFGVASATWVEDPRKLNFDITAVWGTRADDVWAVGTAFNGGVILHYDGTSWTVRERRVGRELHAVWGAGPRDVWVAGYPGVLSHWDGTAWTAVLSGTGKMLRGLWGSSSSDVWAVGAAGDGLAGVDGIILHWDGRAWSTVTCGRTPDFSQVWGDGPNDVWAGGTSAREGPVTFHWDGARWSLEEEPVLSRRWADGSTGPWSSSDGGDAVWGSSAADVWKVRVDGVILHWDGKAWREVFRLEDQAPLVDVWGSGPDDVWAVGEAGRIVHWDGAAWSIAQSGGKADLWAIWGSSGGELWVGGTGQATEHWDGARWNPSPRNEGGTWITAIWGSGPDDVWAVGKETLMRWVGEDWAANDETQGITWGVAGTSSNDVWAVGGVGLRHWDGSTWSPKGPIPESPGRLWATGPNDLWMAAGPAVMRWNGTTWTEALALGGTYVARDVWGRSPNDVWVVGSYVFATSSGFITHWDGKEWKEETLDGQGGIISVSGSGPRDVWALAADTIHHFDGTGWSVSARVDSTVLRSVWARPGGGAWAVGSGGTVLRTAP